MGAQVFPHWGRGLLLQAPLLHQPPDNWKKSERANFVPASLGFELTSSFELREEGAQYDKEELYVRRGRGGVCNYDVV